MVILGTPGTVPPGLQHGRRYCGLYANHPSETWPCPSASRRSLAYQRRLPVIIMLVPAYQAMTSHGLQDLSVNWTRAALCRGGRKGPGGDERSGRSQMLRQGTLTRSGSSRYGAFTESSMRTHVLGCREAVFALRRPPPLGWWSAHRCRLPIWCGTPERSGGQMSEVRKVEARRGSRRSCPAHLAGHRLILCRAADYRDRVLRPGWTVVVALAAAFAIAVLATPAGISGAVLLPFQVGVLQKFSDGPAARIPLPGSSRSSYWPMSRPGTPRRLELLASAGTQSLPCRHRRRAA